MMNTEAMDVEEFAAPDDMTPEQQKVYKQLRAFAQFQNSGFDEIAADIFARDPKMAEKYTAKHRKLVVEKVAASLSDCKMLTDLPVDTVGTLLKLPHGDIPGYVNAVRTIAEAKITLTPAEVKEVVDLSRVIHVMEEEQQEKAKTEMLRQMQALQAQQSAASPGPGVVDADYEEKKSLPNKAIMARMARARI